MRSVGRDATLDVSSGWPRTTEATSPLVDGAVISRASVADVRDPDVARRVGRESDEVIQICRGDRVREHPLRLLLVDRRR
jgi:hypothetical protein